LYETVSGIKVWLLMHLLVTDIRKIYFTHLQQYDENHCVYLTRI